MDKRAQELAYMNMGQDEKKHILLPPVITNNTYPGKRMGMSPEAVQDYIKRQKRCLGKQFDLVTGSNSGLSIQLPGTAYMLLGWAIQPIAKANFTFTGDLTVRLNNEIMIDSVFVDFFGKDFTDEEFYFIPRPLSGQDSFTFSFDNVVNAYTTNVVFYYL